MGRGWRVEQKYISYTSVSTRSSTSAPEALVPLCHHRWTIPLVARLGRTGGERFAVLGHDLGVARQTLRRALDAAVDLGLVTPNPGYGHPLRPEYLLTERGRHLASGCRATVDAAAAASIAIDRKWTLPVLVAVFAGAARFSEVEAALPSATPRALAQALDDGVDAGLLERELLDERPPRPTYRVTRPTRRLARAASRLAAAASA